MTYRTRSSLQTVLLALWCWVTGRRITGTWTVGEES